MTTRPAVVILHYGAPELTGRLHRQLLESDPTWKDVVFVLDNAAPQPYADAWQRLERNLHWGGAFAWALEHCGAQGFQRIWFLNNDILFCSGQPHLERAWQRLLLLERSLGLIPMYSPAITANPYHPQMVRDKGRQWRQVRVMDGIAPLVHIESVAGAGGLDLGENSFGYGVDLWLSARMAATGRPLVVDHQVAVRHTYHSTARKVEGFMDTAAAAQDRYLTQRLGPAWRETVTAMQRQCRDFDSLTDCRQATW